MEYIPVLALIVSAVKITLMWLDYRDCKKAKNTDKDYLSHKVKRVRGSLHFCVPFP